MLDPSVTSVLRTKYTIRTFYVIFGVLFVLSSLLSFSFANLANESNSIFDVYFSTSNSIQVNSFLSSFFGQLSSTFASVMAIYGVWIFSTPPLLRSANIAPLRPNEIQEFLDTSSDDPHQYLFYGRSGKSFRSKILPKLDNLSKYRRSTKYVKVIVPSATPENSQSYASMMRGLSEKADENTLLVSVISMAMDLAIRSRENTDLRVEMALSSNLPILRMDLSEKGGVLTRDAKTLPGIYCGPGGYLDLFRAMAENEFRQSKKVTWDPNVDFSSIKTAQELNAAFEGLPSASEEIMPEVLKSLRAPKSRYD